VFSETSALLQAERKRCIDTILRIFAIPRLTFAINILFASLV